MQDGSVCTGCRYYFIRADCLIPQRFAGIKGIKANCKPLYKNNHSPSLCIGICWLQKVLSVKEYFHKLAAGYKFLFLKACTFVLLLGVCLLFSFCIVYPLWLLATRYTQAYTAISLLLFLALLLFFIVKRSIKSYKAHPRRFLHSLIKKLILFGGLILFFIFIFAYHRILALAVLILSLVLYGFVAFGFSEDRI